MNKIATPQELQAELRRLLAYSQGPQPSRQKLAADLNSLAVRLAAILNGPAPALEDDYFTSTESDYPGSVFTLNLTRGQGEKLEREVSKKLPKDVECEWLDPSGILEIRGKGVQDLVNDGEEFEGESFNQWKRRHPQLLKIVKEAL